MGQSGPRPKIIVSAATFEKDPKKRNNTVSAVEVSDGWSKSVPPNVAITPRQVRLVAQIGTSLLQTVRSPGALSHQLLSTRRT